MHSVARTLKLTMSVSSYQALLPHTIIGCNNRVLQSILIVIMCGDGIVNMVTIWWPMCY